jgi:N-acetyl-anhydromuramyl-L-alanine amidase AmpD
MAALLNPASVSLLGPSPVSMAQVRAWASRRHATNPAGLHDYLRETWRLSAVKHPRDTLNAVTFNHGVLAAQSGEETAGWTSEDWRHNNPAGIAHDDDKAEGARFASPIEGARAQIIHMSAYVLGTLGARDPFRIYLPLDPTYGRVFAAGYAGSIQLLSGLGNGKWATDPDYAAKIAAVLAEMEAMPVEHKPPPVPTDVKKLLPPIVWVDGCANWHPRPNGMRPVAVVRHITDDLSLANTTNWFLDPGSRASAHFVVSRQVDKATGMAIVYQFVRSAHAAWTNGDYATWVNGAWRLNDWRTDIPWLVEAIASCRRQEHNLNDFTINVEHVATPDDPPTEPQYKSSIALGRYFGDRRVYGISPHRGHQLRHSDIDRIERGYCPGPHFDNQRIILALGGDPFDMSH